MHKSFPMVGKAIYPKDLPRILGLGFTSVPQLSLSMGIDKEEAKHFAEAMVEDGILEPWAAAKCPECGFVWPLCEQDTIEYINPDVMCPMCNEVTTTSGLLYYKVYRSLEGFIPDF